MKYHVEFDIDFKRNPYKGLYIALEGIDGSGKSRQAKELVKYFSEQKRPVVLTREPRKEGTLLSDLVQKILRGNVKISPIALQYLFTADRVINQEEIVIPTLKQNKILISDRSFWSIMPYAFPDIGIDFTKKSTNFMLIAQSLLSMYHQFVVPDYIFYLDVPVDVAVKRLSKKLGEEREIYEKRGKIEKHKAGYEWLLKEFPKEFIVIDGTKPIEEVTKDILQALPIKK